MIFTIEHLQMEELKDFLRLQADDAFPNLKDDQRLNMLAEKWHKYAEFCTCRNEEGQLVGMIAFYANQPETKIAYIPHIYVNKEYRGIGIFSALLQNVLTYVSKLGFLGIRLEVDKKNVRAQKAYLKHGFEYDGNTSSTSCFMKRQL